MKVPLRYQNTEYDCGTTSFVNALAFLYDREDIPVELLKAIYRYTLDVENDEGIIGKGGTSREHASLLAKYFVEYANKHDEFNIICSVVNDVNVNIGSRQQGLIAIDDIKYAPRDRYQYIIFASDKLQLGSNVLKYDNNNIDVTLVNGTVE